MAQFARIDLQIRANCMKSRIPVLLFLGFLVFIKENRKITKDFLSLPNPQNPWKRQRKHQNNQENSSLQIYQENPKNQGKEGLG